MTLDTALIPAAGAGVRAYPATHYVPKVMLEVCGKPIIQHNIELLRDKLAIEVVPGTQYLIRAILISRLARFWLRAAFQRFQDTANKSF